jgi:TetR/AcrR family transcriptional regulator, transcriptional repressor for nem operon
MSTTPETEQKSGARERLLTASAQVFRESGYRSASLDEILKRSEVAKSNFYYHFKSKLDLACATVDYWAERLGAQLLGSLLDPSQNGLERLRSFIADFSTLCSRGAPGCPFGMLAAEDDLEPALRKRVRRVLDQVGEGICAALREGQKDGSIRADLDPECLSETVLAALQGAGLLARATREPERIGITTAQLLQLISASRPESAKARRAPREPDSE